MHQTRDILQVLHRSSCLGFSAPFSLNCVCISNLASKPIALRSILLNQGYCSAHCLFISLFIIFIQALSSRLPWCHLFVDAYVCWQLARLLSFAFSIDMGKCTSQMLLLLLMTCEKYKDDKYFCIRIVLKNVQATSALTNVVCSCLLCVCVCVHRHVYIDVVTCTQRFKYTYTYINMYWILKCVFVYNIKLGTHSNS